MINKSGEHSGEMNFFVTVFVFATFNGGVSAAYNETLSRYFLWPLSAAANSDHPEKCVANILNDAQVCATLYFKDF